MQREAHVVALLPREEHDVAPLAVVVKFKGNIPKRQLESLKRVYPRDLMDLFVPDSYDLTRAVEFVTPRVTLAVFLNGRTLAQCDRSHPQGSALSRL
jgi:hypothetical protein